jgi:putative FmdB family regulatory protein
MPTYDYKCKCGIECEQHHKLTEKPKKCKCGRDMERQLSAPVIKWLTDCPTASGGKPTEGI